MQTVRGSWERRTENYPKYLDNTRCFTTLVIRKKNHGRIVLALGNLGKLVFIFLFNRRCWVVGRNLQKAELSKPKIYQLEMGRDTTRLVVFFKIFFFPDMHGF